MGEPRGTRTSTRMAPVRLRTSPVRHGALLQPGTLYVRRRLSCETEASMRHFFGALAIAATIGFAVPANAHWNGRDIAPPGYPWAACSALNGGCASPLYTRRLVAHLTLIVHRHHARIVHRRHIVHRKPTRVVHRGWKLHRIHAGIRGGFQYIDDPQLAAVLAWGDIVNSPPR